MAQAHACETSLNDFLNAQIKQDPTLLFLKEEIDKVSAKFHQTPAGAKACAQHQNWQNSLNHKFESAKAEHYYYPKTCQLKVAIATPLVKQLNILIRSLPQDQLDALPENIAWDEVFIGKAKNNQYYLMKDNFEYKQTSFVSDQYHYTLHRFEFSKLKNQPFSCPSQTIMYPHFNFVPGANERIVNYLVRSVYTRDQQQMFKDSQYAKSKLQAITDKSLYIQPHIDYLGNRILSFHITESIFTGGAHPNHHSKFYVFDLVSQKQIKLTELFSDAHNQEMTQLAKHYFLKQLASLHLTPDDVFLPKGDKDALQEYLYFDIESGFYLPNSFVFHKQGLTFIYQVYEISSYAQGEISFTIPWDALQPFLAESIKGLLASLNQAPIGTPKAP